MIPIFELIACVLTVSTYLTEFGIPDFALGYLQSLYSPTGPKASVADT